MIGSTMAAVEGITMDIARVLALYDQQERREMRYPDAVREVVPPVMRHINVPGRRSFIIYSTLDESNADETIAREAAFFAELGRDLEWKAYAHDKPADLEQRLLAHGFEAEDPETLLICDLGDLPPALQAPIQADIRAVPHEGDLSQWISDILTIEEHVWETDMKWLGERLEHQLRTFPNFISIFVAYVEGKPASVAWINYPEHSQFASLYGGSTLKTYRGRGLYTQLVAIRAQEAITRGYHYLTIDASEMSRPIVEKNGFVIVSTATSYVKFVTKPANA